MDPLNPQDEYQVPKGDTKYLKFEKGQTKFLPLDSAITGYEYWRNDGKPARLKEQPDNPATLLDIRPEDDGTYKVNHFWAFPVIDCQDGKVKVLEITQKTIQRDIRNYIQNEEWGSPVLNYTFTVTREGDGFETKYTTMANPAKEIPAEWKEAWEQVKESFDINELFKNGDPFAPSEDDEVNF